MKNSNALKNTIIAGLFLVPFIPFIVTPSMLFPFITGKNFIFRIIVEIIFALWIILALKDKDYRPKFSWILGFFAIFTVLIGISDILGVHPMKSLWSNFERMEGFISVVHVFLYFVVLSSVIQTQKIWNYFLGTWIGSSVLMCIYALFQLGGKVQINQGGVRVDGTLGNAIYLAVFLMFSIFFLIFLFLRAQNKKNLAWIFGPILILQVVILYYTATRGAVLGLIGGLLVSAVLGVFQKENRLYKKASVFLIIGMVLLIGVFIGIKDTKFVQKSPVFSRFASISPAEIKSQGRYFIWPMAFNGWKERPILGWGQENFNYIFNRDYHPKMYSQEQWFDRAHSTPLDWLVAGGILGFLSYMAIFVFALYYLWKDRNSNLSFLEKSIFTGLLSAYFFQNIFVFDNLISYLLFVTVIAAIHSMGAREVRWPDFFSDARLQTIMSAVMVILLATSLYIFNFRPMIASATLIDALQSVNAGPTKETIGLFKKALSYGFLGKSEVREQMVSASSAIVSSETLAQDVKQEFVDLTRKELDRQLEESSGDMRYYAFYGTFLRNIGQNDEALKMFERAKEFSPQKQSILFELAATQLSKGDFEAALKTFKEAYELEPAYDDAKILYAISAMYARRPELANTLLESVSRSKVLFDDRIISALIDIGDYRTLIEIFTARIAEGRDELNNNIGLAVSYLRNGQRQKSLEILRNFASRKPEFADKLDPYIKQVESGGDL